MRRHDRDRVAFKACHLEIPRLCRLSESHEVPDLLAAKSSTCHGGSDPLLDVDVRFRQLPRCPGFSAPVRINARSRSLATRPRTVDLDHNKYCTIDSLIDDAISY